MRDGVHPLVLRHGHQDAGAFAVDAEILRAACGDQHFGAARGDRARGGGIGLEPVAEALIGDVDHRQRANVVHQRNHRLPFRAGQVGAGGVVAAAMQQHHVARAKPGQIGHHAIEIDAAGFAVEIAVADGFDPQMLEDAEVVGPCRVRHENPRLRVGHVNEIEGLAHRAGAARRGDGGDVVARDGIAQHEADHRVRKRGITRQPGIGLGGFLVPPAALGFLDGAHDRGHALRVLVDADAEVDLVVARIVLVGLHEREDLVLGLFLEMFEHGSVFSGGDGHGGESPHSHQDPS